MSKRFGRNQRRKLRQELASYQEALERESQLASYMRRKGERNAEALRRVAVVLGEHFAALDPSVKQVSHLVDHLNMPRLREPLPTPFDAIGRGAPAREVELAVDMLKAHWAELRTDKLVGMQKVFLGSPVGDFGYAITAQAAHSVPPEYLAKSIAEAFREWLERNLKEAS